MVLLHCLIDHILDVLVVADIDLEWKRFTSSFRYFTNLTKSVPMGFDGSYRLTTVLIVDCWLLGSGGNGEHLEASEVVLPATTTVVISFSVRLKFPFHSIIPAYPSFAKSMAICRPMPRLEPTTMATGFPISEDLQFYDKIACIANTTASKSSSWEDSAYSDVFII